MSRGYVALVLHSHLPFVRHPEHPEFLEERWLFEAMFETYIPLIDQLSRLVNDRVPTRLTLSFSSSLLEMLRDPLLQSRFSDYLDRLSKMNQREMDRSSKDPALRRVVELYRDRIERSRVLFDEAEGDLTRSFQSLESAHAIELITCAATHGFLPFMETIPSSRRAQIELACRAFEECFGHRPRGFWLPECAYLPGIDEELARSGIEYFFVDTHALLHADVQPAFGPYAPLRCPSGVAAFARDIESSKQVWSAKEGYPGDFRYREFYRDIGFDLDREYVRSLLPGGDIRTFTGFKYHRITGTTDHKEYYDPRAAETAVAEHAGNFLFNREKQIEYLASFGDRPPVVVAPYDAELFGHWWFEGPLFIERWVRSAAASSVLELITPGEYLRRHPDLETGVPSTSSWGDQGYFSFWLNDQNDWIYHHLLAMGRQMSDYARRHRAPSSTEHRILTQMARELLQAQASDWPFIIRTGTSVQYATRRLTEHIDAFRRLERALAAGSDAEEILVEREAKNPCFSEIDLSLYA